jgi:hypothetical protein
MESRKPYPKWVRVNDGAMLEDKAVSLRVHLQAIVTPGVGAQKRYMGQMNRFGPALALAMALGLAAAAQAPQGTVSPCARPAKEAVAASRIAGDLRASDLAVVPASKPPVPQGAADLGVAPAGMRLDRVLLLLESSPARQTALDAELANQQTQGSCGWHQWLTPAQFAGTYANSAADVNAVVSWLEQEGFAVAPLPAGRGWIEFSGTAAQVEAAFHSQVHLYATASGVRPVLAANISVQSALHSLIHGLVSLDGVVSAADLTTPKPVTSLAAELAAQTSLAHAEALTPALAAQMLHLDTLHAAGIDGTGETIAIAARSNVQPQDVSAFRSAFGLSANSINVVPVGADPGPTADQAAAEFAASWAGAAAPAAQILIVPAASTQATDGVDLSLASTIDQNSAHTVVVGFSACEASLSEAHHAFYSALYRQAAAQGISVIAAAGDSGASACHVAGSTAPVTTGYAVNALASTPWNTAVGAAAVATADGSNLTSNLAAWSPTTSADAAYAGGGGVSVVHATPEWQPAIAQTSQGRLLPDLSLPTATDSAFSRGLAFCFSGTSPTSGCTVVRSGGSSAAAALFGGISALLAQKYGPQGNLAPQLYGLRSQSGVFEDIAQGTARLNCAAGSPGCDASGRIGYDAAAGFDLATGLGSPDADKLASVWARPAATGTGAATVVLTVSPMVANATYNPSALITYTASVSSTSGPTPTGTVQFTAGAPTGPFGSSVTLDSGGNAVLPLTGGLALGGNSITAVYSGDSNYAASSSLPKVVTIQQSSTSMTLVPSTTAPAAGSVITVALTMVVGIPPAGTMPPGGKVTLNVDGLANSTASLVTTAGVTTATFSLTVPTVGGAHNLQAIYNGDANYVASVSPAVPVTVGKGATVTSLTATPAVLTPGTAEVLTATISPINPVTGTTYTITGSVAFYDGTTLLGSALLALNSATLSNVTLATGISHVITAVYSGDVNWAASTSNPVDLTAALFADTVVLTVSPSSANPGQVVTLIATVTPAIAPASTTEQNPTGNVIFYVGTKVIGTVALSASLNNTSTAMLLNATLPAGQDVLTAVYVGDLFYATGTSNSITINVLDFSIAPSGTNSPTNLSIVKGTAGTASFVVTGLGGFNGQISVVCAVPTQDDMTCSPSPQQFVPTGTVTFTVQTYLTGGSIAAVHPAPPLWSRAAGGTALAALLFFLLPIGRRARLLTESTRRVLIPILFLMSFCGLVTGCQSVSGSAAGISSGTPLGVSTLTITAASYVDNTVVSHSVFLTVNVLPPGSTGDQPNHGGQ